MTHPLTSKLDKFDAILSTVEAQVSDLADSTRKVSDLVDSFDHQMVSYDALANTPYYIPLPLDTGVTSYRIPAPPGLLTFVVTFKNQSLLKKHKHDCKQLLYKLTGDLYHLEQLIDTTHEIPAGQEHVLVSPSGSLLVVHFEQPV